MSKIKVYCDGACRGNQHKNNIGSYAIVLQYKGKTKEFTGVRRCVTNNIMELMAVTKALKMLKAKDIPVEVYSDSRYVVDGINIWIHNWKKNDWKTARTTREEVANKEMWQELLELTESFKDIKIMKVKGHADNKGNIRADELCNIAMDNYTEQQKSAL